MINAIILIPEVTKGMKSVGSKSLLKIKNNKYIVHHQVEQLYSISKKINITVATGFDHDKVAKALEKYPNVNIIRNADYQQTNFGKCIELYLNQSPKIDNLLIVNSGVLFKQHTFALTHFRAKSKLFVLDKPKNNFDIGCSTGLVVEYLFYDLPIKWSECVYLNEDAVTNLHKLLESCSISQMYIFEILNKLISSNTIFEQQVVPKSNFLKISTAKDLNRARMFV